ncbi:hypothetical protein ABPG74_017521 [Tetrahymena malaccensis]
MDNLNSVSSPSLSSSPSTKEQSTEQPKSSERKNLKDQDRVDITPSKIQSTTKTKKQKQNDELLENNSDIKNFSIHGEEQEERDTVEDSKTQEAILPNDQQLTSQAGSVQHSQEEALDKQNDKEEDQNEDYEFYEEEDYEEEEDLDDEFLERDEDNDVYTTEDGSRGVKQKKNKFTKEFISAIKSNSEELRNEKSDDPLDYLFVIDFECNQPGSEIIEFPITVVDLKQRKVVDTFHSYVRPTKIKKLSNFIKKLTGIKQEDVDASDSIETIINRVEAFLSKYQQFKAAILYDCANDAKFLSNEIKNKQLNITNKFLLSYINLRNVFPINLTGGIKNISLSHALEVLDMSFEGQKHTGRDDSINIARVCMEMINHQFTFTQFMRQSQFCLDNPKRLVDSTINDLFKMNKYLIALDIKFYGDKKDLNTKNNVILCKSFKFHLFQIKQGNSDSVSSTQVNQNIQTTPQKSSFKLKTSAEKHAEQQLLQQQKILQQKQQLQQQQPEKQNLENQQEDTSTVQKQQVEQNLQNSQAQSNSNSNLNKQQQQKEDMPQQIQQKQTAVKLNLIDEIDCYYQEFNNLQYQLQEYYELLQNLIDLYHKHDIKCQNSMIILNSSTKQKYFSKFFKFITTMFKTNKTAFIFKKKILNLQELLEKQIIIDQKQADLILAEEFPQNIIKLVDFFQTQNFTVKELPQCFQKKTVLPMSEGQQNQYRDMGQYPYQYYDSPQYGSYLSGFYSQKQQSPSKVLQQQPFGIYQQHQQNIDYFNANTNNQNFNQLQMMYQLQQQAQHVYNQQNAALANQQNQPFYFQQAINQMNNNYIYQMQFFNPAVFSFPTNSMDNQLQQQIMFHSQQFLQQFEQNSSQQFTFPPQNNQQTQQQHQQSLNQSQQQQQYLYNYKQPTYPSQQSSSSTTQHNKSNSSFFGNNYPTQSLKNNNNQKNEGQNISRKKNFRNNSQIYNGFQNNGFYQDPYNNSNINSSYQNFQKSGQNNSSNIQINSSPLISFPAENKRGQNAQTSQPTLYSSYIQNSGLNKPNTFSNQNKNKFYKK